ncbi:MAG: GAF domain-containing sensor histidine kinase [Geitlerinemataceae cyanobacterium]
MTVTDREQQRLQALTESGLLEKDNIPVLNEAAVLVANFLEIPICIASVMDRDWQWLKAEVGWSDLEQMQSLSTARQLKRSECFCAYVIDSEQVLAIRDTTTHPIFAHRLFVGHYGIRAYLGVPLITSSGYCLGTIAVMDLAPREFRPKEIEFVELTARWCMAELERFGPIGTPPPPSKNTDSSPPPLALPSSLPTSGFSIERLKVELVAQLMQELRTPLTSVMGMTSVLSREIYGPLRRKQKEYLKIIHDSGQYLLSLVEEILSLRELSSNGAPLSLISVDVEMLCQQVLKTLEPVANRREQQIQVSVEPVHRIWLLDKGKVQQLLYHLMFRVVQVSEGGCVIRVHVCRKEENLNIGIWVSHPWLGDSLPESELEACGIVTPSSSSLPDATALASEESVPQDMRSIDVWERIQDSTLDRSRERLGLLLSCQLAQMHGGSISIQGTPRSGYRYIVSLPEKG